MTEITFTIMGSIPSKKNGKKIVPVRGRATIVSNGNYQRWERNAKHSLGIQKIMIGTHKFPIIQASVEIEFYFKDLRPHDLSNSCEGILDALVLAEVFPDDSWRFVPTLTLRAMGVDRKDARAVIRIRTLDESLKNKSENKSTK